MIEDYSNDYTTQEANNEFFCEEMKGSVFEEYGLIVAPHYSLSYCQGDGLKDKFINEVLKQKLSNADFRLLEYANNNGYKITLNNKNSHYCYASKYDVEMLSVWSVYEDYKIDFPTSKKTKIDFDEAFERVEKIVIDWYLKECKKWERLGYEAIYYIPTFEEFEEQAKDNEWKFLESGELYSC